MMIFCDSFNLYEQDLMEDMWDVVSVPVTAGVALTQGLTIGRFGSGGVSFTAGVQPQYGTSGADRPVYIQKNYDGVSVIHIGLAVLQNATQITEGGRLITLLDSATTQVGIDIMPSGQLRAIRSTVAGTGIYLESVGAGNGPTYTVLGTSVSAISSSSYDFLEFKVTHHPTAGIVEVKRNGIAFWTLSGVNTAISGTNQSASVLVGGYIATLGDSGSAIGESHLLRADVSDFHLLNTTANGSDELNPVDFIGDRHWEAVTPTVDGNYTEWTPDPTDVGQPDEHAQNVNTIPPNTARNNNTEGVGDRDTFECADAAGPTTASVILAYTPYLEKNTGGAVGVSGIFRLAGSDRNGTEFQVPNPIAYRQSFLCSKPGGGAITIADVNNGEHGYERTS